MPPLTLEQILARSMRMSRRRAPVQVAHLFAAQGGKMQEPHTAPTTRGLRGGASGFFADSDVDDKVGRRRTLFDTTAGLLHNGVDLLSYLQSARQLGAWEDGLAAFLHATHLHNHDVCGTAPDPHPVALSSTVTPAGTNEMHAGVARTRPGIHPTAAHVIALLDTLAEASQWILLQNVARYFAIQFPDVITHAATLLCKRPNSTAATDATTTITTTVAISTSRVAAGYCPSWRDAFDFVRSLPTANIPLAAYNAILTGCEGAVDWRGALEVFAALGCNPLQEPVKNEGADRAASVAASDTTAMCNTHDEHAEGEMTASPMNGATQSPDPSRRATPAPDVVSYATLLATLEQAGEGELAAKVLRQLPATAREEVTASYAALIYVWSKQSTSRRGPWRRY